jgi:drug/metabolite transporter (DMT)-like permease
LIAFATALFGLPTVVSWACRASIPVFTCVLAVVVENKIPTRGEVASLVILTVGVMIAVWEGTVTGSPRAILLCIGGTLSNAAMMTTSGKVLSEKVDALRLTFYTAPISLLALLPAFFLREVSFAACLCDCTGLFPQDWLWEV